MSYKRIIKKTGKILLYILLCVFVLVCVFFVFINMPAGKRMVKNKAQAYLENKLKTKVIIGSINYSLPNSIELNNIYLEDQKKDTLFFGEKIAVDISMLKLIWGNTDVQKVALKNVFLNVYRGEKDSSFNYQFIIDAFAGSKPKVAATKDTTALKINLGRLILAQVSLRFADKNGGTDFTAAIKSLDASLSKFQPDRVDFGLKDFIASGVDFFMTTYKA
ncbi:MAG: AsmA family protein, partial [Ferruginibacter sp.]